MYYKQCLKVRLIPKILNFELDALARPKSLKLALVGLARLRSCFMIDLCTFDRSLTDDRIFFLVI